MNKIFTIILKYTKKYKKSLKLVKKYVKFILTKYYVNSLLLVMKNEYLQNL